MMKRVLCAVAGLAMVPALAMGQWSDNFDAYTAGSINGQGGWQGWDGVPAAAGTVSTTIARSGPHSQAINNTSDSVRTYSGVTSGQWSYVAYQYIPQDFTGQTYFILNSQYNNNGPYQWAVQLLFDAGTNLVTDDNGRPENQVNIVRGQWAQIRVDFDLTANTISEFYNGQLLATGAWVSAPTPILALGGVDLYGGTGSTVYYDDMDLRGIPAPAAFSLLGMAGIFAARRRRA